MDSKELRDSYGCPPYDKVKEFHEAFGAPVARKPGLIDAERSELRLDLIEEEYFELIDAVEAGDIIEIADALGDLEYVINGMALEYGINLPRVFNEIHSSNMSKLGRDGKPIYRDDGKILKGEDYRPPNLKEMI
jgi:predicted HAD superfamily Cof-like phosphohydrolase